MFKSSPKLRCSCRKFKLYSSTINLVSLAFSLASWGFETFVYAGMYMQTISLLIYWGSRCHLRILKLFFSWVDSTHPRLSLWNIHFRVPVLPRTGTSIGILVCCTSATHPQCLKSSLQAISLSDRANLPSISQTKSKLLRRIASIVDVACHCMIIPSHPRNISEASPLRIELLPQGCGKASFQRIKYEDLFALSHSVSALKRVILTCWY